MNAGADWGRTCAGCEYIREEPWPKRGSYHEEVTAFRCFAPGPRQGYHMGTERFFPYVPAWCPEMERGAGEYGTEKDVPRRL